MQGILLYMAIYYEIQARNRGAHRLPLEGQPGSHLYANGFDDETPEQLIIDSQESDAVAETAPLLKPGGIGDSHRNYDTNRG